jgi:ABC-type antimicrobial peptide transport system permease subunit
MKFIPEHIREEIEGDLAQRFERDIRRHGLKRARMKLYWNTLLFYRPGILFRKNPLKKYRAVFMLKSYLVIAIRNMRAHKTNSSINALSLVVGITSALIMASVIRYELSFDRFHSNTDRIYRIYRESVSGFETRESGIAYPISDVFRDEVSSIEKIAGVQYYGGAQVDIEINGEAKRFREENGLAIVDQQFFDIFDFKGTGFKWISGDPKTALTEPATVVLTESLAKKNFGEADPLGKSIRLEGQLDVKVTGVVKDIPLNSDLAIKIFASYATLYYINDDKTMKEDWVSINADHQAFVLLPENVTAAEVEVQFDKVHVAHVPKDVSEARKYRLQPLTKLHQDAKLGNINRRTVDTTALWIMAITGLLLLSVGCINYINIATAQSTLRGREIGVRKVLGGQRKQLIFQLLSETLVLVVIACVVSLFLAEVILLNISSLTNTVLLTHLFLDPFVLAWIGLLIVGITLTAGFYPAIIVSSYGITNSLKGIIGSRASGNYLRKTLVVVQFAVTQAFLIGSFIVINQLRYSREFDMGFEKDLIINIPVVENSISKMGQLRDMVLNNPSVGAFSIGSSFPSGAQHNHWWVSIRKKETPKEQDEITELQSIDTSYLSLYGIDIKAGRNFLNSDSIGATIVNEQVAKKFGFKTVEEAVGHPVVIDGKDYTIVGVCSDFMDSSTRDEISNMTFIYKPKWFYMSSVKLDKNVESLQKTIVELEKTWSIIYPDMLFDYDFFDEVIDRYYQQERKLSTMMQVFSGVFLLLACLGLYGLLSFVINRRMKEVAVRKVFGATISNILTLISKDYVRLILISFVIAAPLSYYFMDQWLESYKFHIPITWWILVAPGVFALVIAVGTLSGKLVRAASRNPADTLKYE